MSEGSCSPLLQRKRTELDLKIQTPVLNLASTREFQRNSLKPGPKTPLVNDNRAKRPKSNSLAGLGKPTTKGQKTHMKKKSEASLEATTILQRLSTFQNAFLVQEAHHKENRKKSLSTGLTRVASRDQTPPSKRPTTPLR